MFRRLLRFIGWLLLSWFVVTILVVLLFRWVDPPTSAFILRERVIGATANPSYQVKQRWVDWPQISPQMKVAVIASEDQTFPDHFGFDFKSIDKALDDRERGRRVRGASTLSQQVAKNLFLWPGRNWIRKGLEAYFTLLIETLWPKQRILETYLNIAEFGKGVFGVGVASETYFRKPAAKLNAYDAALLAAVLPNPKRLKANAPSSYVRSRQQWIVGQMRGLGGTAVLQRLE
ncbi:MAG TPA: monofunctional biosynthetic peptidoglycan transglycosylase [Povalibacter sp.]|uniref:monofunctional biosynthetic peptidoglycan transglycosylase n=1 Tax=Povalibacter sp. TaxID=1962978 RepID=UPI002C034BA5|nr:monofunctional biosynthetic peptidoglycan transglycosylase [Povalibacter sp.]HMN46424.1 monofunctional biosynthetic peptidoglycan transglycosylase [Povalibacter sp.]